MREIGRDESQRGGPLPRRTLQTKGFGAPILGGISPKLFAAVLWDTLVPFYTHTSSWLNRKMKVEEFRAGCIDRTDLVHILRVEPPDLVAGFCLLVNQVKSLSLSFFLQPCPVHTYNLHMRSYPFE